MADTKPTGWDHTEAEQAVKKAHKPMTDHEYVKDSGSCPYCRSGEIEGGHITIEGGGAWQEVTCTTCGKTWTDSYMLTGYLGQEADDHEPAGQHKVTVEVAGGVADVTACPLGVKVTIIDHDNAGAEADSAGTPFPASSRPRCSR